MSNTRRVAGNLLSLFSGEAISSALAFAITILLARRLQDEGFGLLAVVQSIMMYLALATDLGLGTYGTRQIARYPDQASQISGSIISLRLFLGLAIAIPFAIGVALWPMPPEMRWLCWTSAAGLLTQAVNPEFAFQGTERMSGIAIWRVLVHILYFFLLFVFITGRDQLWTVPLMRFFAEALTVAIIISVLVRKDFRLPRLCFRPSQWRGYLRESLVMAASVIVIRFYYTFDTILLGILDRSQVVGWYQAAYKIILLFMGATSLIQMAFAPNFSKHWQDRQQMIEIMRRYAILMTFLGSMAGASLAFLHQDLISVIFGSSYAGASSALLVLAISLFLVFLFTIFLTPLLFTGRQNKYLIFMSVAVVSNIAINIVLIPRFSLLGAALAVTISNLILLVIVLFDYYRQFRETTLHLLLLQMTGAALLVYAIITRLFPNRWLACLLYWVVYSLFVYWLNRKIIKSVIFQLLPGSWHAANYETH